MQLFRFCCDPVLEFECISSSPNLNKTTTSKQAQMPSYFALNIQRRVAKRQHKPQAGGEGMAFVAMPVANQCLEMNYQTWNKTAVSYNNVMHSISKVFKGRQNHYQGSEDPTPLLQLHVKKYKQQCKMTSYVRENNLKNLHIIASYIHRGIWYKPASGQLGNNGQI